MYHILLELDKHTYTYKAHKYGMIVNKILMKLGLLLSIRIFIPSPTQQKTKQNPELTGT